MQHPKCPRFSLVALALAIAAAPACAATVDLQLDAMPAAGPAQAQALDSFRTAVEGSTHGRVRVTLRTGRSRLTSAALVEGMMFGDTDLLSGYLSNYLPLMIDEVSGLSTPFLIPGADPARAYIASPLLDEARRKVLESRHIRFLEMNAVRRPFHWIVAKRPVRGPDDLKGLRLMTLAPITKIAAGLWQDLGVTYVAPLPRAEWAAAMKDGRIDAVLFPDVASARDSRLDPTGRNSAALDDCPAIWEISVNEAAWARLTPGDQALVGRAAQAAATVFQQASDAEVEQERRRFGHPIPTFDAMAARHRLGPAYRALADQGLINPKVLMTADATARSISGDQGQ